MRLCDTLRVTVTDADTVGARVVALGEREPELHLDTVGGLLEAARVLVMLRVRDTVGVEEGQTLGVLMRVVALWDWESVREVLRVNVRVAIRVVGLGDMDVLVQRERVRFVETVTEGDTVGVAEHTGSRYAWMLMP